MPRYIVNGVRHYGLWGSLYLDFQVIDTHTGNIVAEGLKYDPALKLAADLNREHRGEARL